MQVVKVRVPAVLKALIQVVAQELHDELSYNKLEVILVPAPELKHSCHKIRCVETRNPIWFQELNSDRKDGSGSSSKHRIARDRVLKSLQRIIDDDLYKGRYYYISMNLIEKRLIKSLQQLHEDRRTTYSEEPF